MAYQFVDPAPFIPRGFQRVVVPNRKAMSRVILGRPTKRNPDVAIVTMLTVKIRQPSHEFTFGVGTSFIPYPLVLTPRGITSSRVHVSFVV
jgi:hypothetical protein